MTVSGQFPELQSVLALHIKTYCNYITQFIKDNNLFTFGAPILQRGIVMVKTDIVIYNVLTEAARKDICRNVFVFDFEAVLNVGILDSRCKFKWKAR